MHIDTSTNANRLDLDGKSNEHSSDTLENLLAVPVNSQVSDNTNTIQALKKEV